MERKKNILERVRSGNKLPPTKDYTYLKRPSSVHDWRRNLCDGTSNQQTGRNDTDDGGIRENLLDKFREEFVGGHTNGIPPHDYCDKLSTARAEAVAKYLIQKGIEDERIQFKGYGKRKPIASNNSEEGRKRNQRVEIKIISMDS